VVAGAAASATHQDGFQMVPEPLQSGQVIMICPDPLQSRQVIRVDPPQVVHGVCPSLSYPGY
jgi:hypothetical protein